MLPSLVTPLLEVEASECATVADYAPPAVPPVESVLESTEYTIPEDSGCSWTPDFVPGSDGTNMVCANYFFGFYMWGRVPGWQLVSRVGVLNCGDTPVQII